MPIWHIIYFPPSDGKDSPYEYIKGLSDKSEQAQITRRLKELSERELVDWPSSWVHKVDDKILQLTAHDHRIMFCIDQGELVVLHACRKVKGKTHTRDLKRACINYTAYFEKKQQDRDQKMVKS